MLKWWVVWWSKRGVYNKTEELVRQDAEYAAAAVADYARQRGDARDAAAAEAAAEAALSAEELRRLRVARFAPAPAPPPD
jgi:hypothetical protein